MKSLLIYLASIIGYVACVHAGEVVNIDKNGLALQGYDPVGYFTDGKPVKGSPEFTASYKGATYQFASAEHRDLFQQSPAKYEPQFGGYCAYGASRGKTVPIKIETWEIVNGRLLLQYDLDVKSKFDKDPQGTLRKADENWPGLVEKYGK